MFVSRRLRCESFELHLLESGISGIKSVGHENIVLKFELHLLESGISGWNFSIPKP